MVVVGGKVEGDEECKLASRLNMQLALVLVSLIGRNFEEFKKMEWRPVGCRNVRLFVEFQLPVHFLGGRGFLPYALVCILGVANLHNYSIIIDQSGVGEIATWKFDTPLKLGYTVAGFCGKEDKASITDFKHEVLQEFSNRR